MPKIPANSTEQCLRLTHLHGGVVMYRPGESLHPRTLNDWELVLILEGNATYRCNRTSWSAPPGAVVFGRPGFREHYLWDSLRPTRHAYFHFGIAAVPRDWPAMEHWPLVQTDLDPVVPALFRHVVQQCQAHPRWAAQAPSRDITRVVEALIGILLQANLRQARQATDERPEPIQRCLQWMRQRIDDDPARPVCLADLAAAANLSPKHLCRLFHQSLGHSPMDAFRLLRLQLSVALLSRSSLTIKQVAARCGFRSPFHFSRCFRAAYDRSPREARSRMLVGKPPPPALLPPDLMPRVWW